MSQSIVINNHIENILNDLREIGDLQCKSNFGFTFIDLGK